MEKKSQIIYSNRVKKKSPALSVVLYICIYIPVCDSLSSECTTYFEGVALYGIGMKDKEREIKPIGNISSLNKENDINVGDVKWSCFFYLVKLR